MLNPKDISNTSFTNNDQKKLVEKKLQSTDLDYLSSIAFEKFIVPDSEIEGLNKLIDKKSLPNLKTFNTVFVSVLCGLLIGISLFFVIFHKNKTHPSVFQLIADKAEIKKLDNKISATDTVFPTIKFESKPIEHFAILTNVIEEPSPIIVADVLPSKPTEMPQQAKDNTDIILQFIPNAPVVFINNLKVTNYRLYYFKQNTAINLSINSGLSAQYESNATIDALNLNKSDSYFAHKIIQRSMRFYSGNNYANCIEELTMLYDFNGDDANAQFYLGMCYYQTGKYAIAQRYFEKNLNNQNNIFHQESEYYEALCFLNTNQKNKAFVNLQRIVNNKGFYTIRAQAVLNKK